MSDNEKLRQRITQLEARLNHMRKSKEGLAETRNCVDRVFADMPGAVLVHRNGLILFANPSAAELIGIGAAEQLVGRHLHEFSNDRIRVSDDWEKPASTTRPRPEIQKWRRVDGAEILVEILGSTSVWSGKPAIVLSLCDVTERKQLEEELRQNQGMDLLGRWAGGIAHDLNNLLLPIITFTEVVMDDVSITGEAWAKLEKVIISAKRGRDLVRQITAFNRLDPICIEPVALRDIVEKATSYLRSMLPSTIGINLKITDDVFYLRADANQILQVIIHLSTIASPSTEDEVRTIDITLNHVNFDDESTTQLDGLAPGSYAQLIMANSSGHMDEEIKRHIFDPCLASKTPVEGNGFVLTVVKQIIDAHDGKMEVSSVPENGMAVVIYLPLLNSVAIPAGDGM